MCDSKLFAIIFMDGLGMTMVWTLLGTCVRKNDAGSLGNKLKRKEFEP